MKKPIDRQEPRLHVQPVKGPIFEDEGFPEGYDPATGIRAVEPEQVAPSVKVAPSPQVEARSHKKKANPVREKAVPRVKSRKKLPAPLKAVMALAFGSPLIFGGVYYGLETYGPKKTVEVADNDTVSSVQGSLPASPATATLTPDVPASAPAMPGRQLEAPDLTVIPQSPVVAFMPLKTIETQVTNADKCISQEIDRFGDTLFRPDRIGQLYEIPNDSFVMVKNHCEETTGALAIQYFNALSMPNPGRSLYVAMHGFEQYEMLGTALTGSINAHTVALEPITAEVEAAPLPAPEPEDEIIVVAPEQPARSSLSPEFRKVQTVTVRPDGTIVPRDDEDAPQDIPATVPIIVPEIEVEAEAAPLPETDPQTTVAPVFPAPYPKWRDVPPPVQLIPN